MARRPMQHLARWHICLGWLAAVPLLVWTISGLVMTLRPIEEVRGEHLRRPPLLLATAGLVAPRVDIPVRKLALVEEAGAPVWVATAGNGQLRRFAADGTPLAPVGESEARALAVAAYAGPARLATLRRHPADAAPLDLRRERPAWQAGFADGTRVYIDADSGEVLALRTGYWRFYDLMWGLHIMDPLGRENTSHALLWLFSTLALASSLLGTVLLFRRRKARA